MDDRYDPHAVEEKWQAWWEAQQTFRACERPGGRKYYVLEMFPYPSGRIHMGHVRNYSIGDVVARFRRMRGYEVIHPIGWDAFGLPAENAAIERGVHPAAWTEENIANMRRQLRRLGFSYDWTREITTCDPEYYRWEQLFFTQMFERDLAYRRRSLVNWCPGCETVLANEQVVDGSCWRCDSRVEERDLEQWFLRITAYAEELLADCDRLEGWPERVLAMQRNWIGRSPGAEIRFPLAGRSGDLPVFTTRQDTVYGATFMSVAPEHPRLRDLARGTGQEAAVDAFVARVSRQTREERTEGKEGVFTGAYCENPFTGARIPIYAANFVLTEYGTGAVMAVPAHDQRDFEFAGRYGLPVVPVVHPPGEHLQGSAMTAAYEGPGILSDSGPFSDLDSETAKARLVEHLAATGLGGRRVQYRLRDWGISRQRYWGAPIPIVYCQGCGTVPVPADQLPVRLPMQGGFSGRGGSPLARQPSFVSTRCPRCGGAAQRETDTMDTFVESSWYFFRFAGPDARDAPWRPEGLRYWLPVDQYIGGIEHAVMHLLYARFFSKALRDLGWLDAEIPNGEPFVNLLTQGMVTKDGAAMSKSRGNVVEPDALIERYGADTVRLFCLFAAPPEKDLEWSDQGVEGAARFLGRVWRLVARCQRIEAPPAAVELPSASPGRSIERIVHRTIRRVTDDIEVRVHLNTAIAAIMELVNALAEFAATTEAAGAAERRVFRTGVETAVMLLAPFVPHLASELWEALGHPGGLDSHPWPEPEAAALAEDEVLVVVQVDGRVRGRIRVSAGAEKAEVVAAALRDPGVQRHVRDRTVRRTIVVPDRLVNLVLG